MTILLLGGTAEARELASRELASRELAGGEPASPLRVISSLAGRTSAPLLPAGEVRVGGFGGVEGLTRFLRTAEVEVLIDATHPFAATMTSHAVAAAEAAGIPMIVLRRPGFAQRAGDVWHRVGSVAGAAGLVPQLGRRILLTTGRQSIAEFAGLDGWFLSRSVEAPEPPMPQQLEVVLERGPFTVPGELALLRRHRIDVLVTKDSGGGTAKLAAARELGVPVVMVDRPPLPEGVPVATSVDAAVELLHGMLGRRRDR